MRHFIVALFLWAVAAASSVTAHAADGQVPSYLILKAPARTPKGSAYYPGRGYEVKAQTYAYGWFGVQPRGTWKRSTGYYSSYIQWSKQ